MQCDCASHKRCTRLQNAICNEQIGRCLNFEFSQPLNRLQAVGCVHLNASRFQATLCLDCSARWSEWHCCSVAATWYRNSSGILHALVIRGLTKCLTKVQSTVVKSWNVDTVWCTSQITTRYGETDDRQPSEMCSDTLQKSQVLEHPP
jgi:hypothetical protein